VSTSSALEIGLAPAMDDSGAPAADSPDRVDERELLVRLRRGEPAAFETLVRLHQDRVFDFCLRMLGDREEALELVQDIFVSVHQHLRRFREDAKLSTWIFRISKNQCLNRIKYLRRRGRGKSDELEDVSESLLVDALGGSPKPDEALAAKRERQMVQDAIARLDPDQRLLVALRDIEGLSYEEIVEITELPEGTVKSRLHRAREKLAELIGGLED
jgi:RNA polymerase sigma-70 factor, ECF subfamily